MEKNENSIKLTESQHLKLLSLKQKFKQLGEIDPFSLYDPESKELGFFKDFKQYVDGKAKLFQKLSLFAESSQLGQTVAKRSYFYHMTAKISNPESNQVIQSITHANEVLKSTHQQIQTKADEILFLARNCLNEISLFGRFNSEYSNNLFSAKESLKMILSKNNQAASAKVRAIDEELHKAREILENMLQEELETPSGGMTKNHESRNQETLENPLESKNVGLMTDQNEKDPESQNRVSIEFEMREIIIKRGPNQSGMSLAETGDGRSPFFTFHNKCALISPSNGYGKLIKNKEDQSSYTRQMSQEITEIVGVVECREVYYYLNSMKLVRN